MSKWSNVKVVKFWNWSKTETGQKSKWSNPLSGFSGITSMHSGPCRALKKSLTMKFLKKSTFADFNIPPTDPPKDLTRFDREVRIDIFSPPHSSDSPVQTRSGRELVILWARKSWKRLADRIWTNPFGDP
jgi:hypothetical protein